VIFQHKPLRRSKKGIYEDIYFDKNAEKKVLDLGPQEDIRELSGEDEQ